MALSLRKIGTSNRRDLSADGRQSKLTIQECSTRKISPEYEAKRAPWGRQEVRRVGRGHVAILSDRYVDTPVLIAFYAFCAIAYRISIERIFDEEKTAIARNLIDA